MDASASCPPTEIIVVKSLEERQQCYDVRINVFVDEQKFPLEVEIDEYEDIATHFLLRLTPSLVPIGTIRAVKLPDAPYYKLSRLAILRDYRKHGYGSKLVEALHDWARSTAKQAGQIDSALLVAESQVPAKIFYARNGYQPEGEEFDLDGQPHQKMVIQLPLHEF